MTRKWLSCAAVAATLVTLLGFAPLTGPAVAQSPSPAPKMMRKMPPRNAKGQFMKASPSPKPMVTAKKMTAKKTNMPMRNAKGQFVKAPTPAPKMAHKMPMRNAKGQFMKASPAAPTMPKP